jgi:hypothetical protein
MAETMRAVTAFVLIMACCNQSYPREGHGLREEKHLLDRLNRIINWFDTPVK